MNLNVDVAVVAADRSSEKKTDRATTKSRPADTGRSRERPIAAHSYRCNTPVIASISPLSRDLARGSARGGEQARRGSTVICINTHV